MAVFVENKGQRRTAHSRGGASARLWVVPPARVRILCPTGGIIRTPDGALRAGPPWPDDLKTPSGELPEYVAIQEPTWVPIGETDSALAGEYTDVKWVPFGTAGNSQPFKYRARVDSVLVTDGKIIDLNRVQLSSDTLIIANRFKEKHIGIATPLAGRPSHTTFLLPTSHDGS